MENQKPSTNPEQSQKKDQHRVHPLWHIGTIIFFILFILSIFFADIGSVIPMLLIYLICGWKSSKSVYQDEKNALDYIAIIFSVLFFIIRYLLKDILNNTDNSSMKNADTTYVINPDGTKRELKYFSRQHNAISGDYDRYIDDLGFYWKTYDGGKTFLKDE